MTSKPWRARLLPRQRACGPLASLGFWLAVALVVWLDSDRCVLALRPGIELHTAHVFTIIVGALQTLAGWLSTAATVTVTYLAQAVAYLSTRVWTLLKSTGAMFARVWDASKIVVTDVLKPALKWLDAQLTRLHTWLQKTFKPVFDFLARVRDELQAIYKRFVRPVIDTIEFLRALNRVLLTFHITLLQQLDATLQKIEQRIEEPFLWIYQELHSLWYWLDRVVDLDGLFQRWTLVRSMERYAPDWITHFWERQTTPGGTGNGGDGGSGDALDVKPTTYAKELGEHLQGNESPISGYVRELVPLWREAAGVRDS